MTKFELLKKYVKKNAGKFKFINEIGIMQNSFQYGELKLWFCRSEFGMVIDGEYMDILSQKELEEVFNYLNDRRIKLEKNKHKKKVADFFKKIGGN